MSYEALAYNLYLLADISFMANTLRYVAFLRREMKHTCHVTWHWTERA